MIIMLFDLTLFLLCLREQSYNLLCKGKRDGTFLVRSRNAKPGDKHTHTIDIL